jgi:hypothetical protein
MSQLDMSMLNFIAVHRDNRSLSLHVGPSAAGGNSIHVERSLNTRPLILATKGEWGACKRNMLSPTAVH